MPRHTTRLVLYSKPKKRIDEALAEYRTAISIDPKNQQYQKAMQDALDVKAQPIIKEAVAQHEAKNYPKAIELYKQAIMLRPARCLTLVQRRQRRIRLNYQDAKLAYQKAVEIDPKGQVDCLYLIGTIDENYGKGLDAQSDYQKFLSQAPANDRYIAAAKERLAALNRNIADTIKIKSEADMLADKQADDAFTKAVQLQQQKQYDQAIALYQQAIQVKPKNADFIYSLGTCYQQKGDFDNALQSYNQAMAMQPTNKDFKAAYDGAMAEKGEPMVDEAVKKQTAGDSYGCNRPLSSSLEIHSQQRCSMDKLRNSLSAVR